MTSKIQPIPTDSKRIEIIPRDLPGYERLVAITGITSPTHQIRMIYGLAGVQLADHLEGFSPLAIESINQASQTRPTPIPETNPQDLANFSYVEVSSSDIDEPINL